MDKKNTKNKFSLWCLVIWNMLIFGVLLFIFGNLLRRNIIGVSTGVEELFFLVLIPIFLAVNIRPAFTNIKKLYISYHENLLDETVNREPEVNRYAFMDMYKSLSRRRIGLLLLVPFLYILVISVLLPILSKGVLSWKSLFVMFTDIRVQIAFLPAVIIPIIISVRVYFLSRYNIYMLEKVYEHLQEAESIDSIKEKQMAYIFTEEFLINWDGCLNIVPLKEIKKIEYVRYFYFVFYGTRLRINCNKKYLIWNCGPSEAEWIERGFFPPSKKANKKVSFNIQLPH